MSRAGGQKAKPGGTYWNGGVENYDLTYDGHVRWHVTWDTQPNFDGILLGVAIDYQGNRATASYVKDAGDWAQDMDLGSVNNGGLIDSWVEVRNMAGELVAKLDTFEIEP